MRKDLLESVRSLNETKKDYEHFKNKNESKVIPDEAGIPDVMRGLGTFMRSMGMDMGMFTSPNESIAKEKEAKRVDDEVLSWDYKTIEPISWGIDVADDSSSIFRGGIEKHDRFMSELASCWMDEKANKKEQAWLKGFKAYEPTGNYDIDNSFFAKQLNQQDDCPSDPYLHDNIPDHKELTPNEVNLINRILDKQTLPDNPDKVYIHGISVSRHPRGESKEVIAEVTRDVGFRYLAYLYTSGSILLEGKESPYSPKFSLRFKGADGINLPRQYGKGNSLLEVTKEDIRESLLQEDSKRSQKDYDRLVYRRSLKNGYLEEVNEWSDVVGMYTYKNGARNGYFELFNEFNEDVYMKGYQKKGKYYGLLTKYFNDGTIYGTYNYNKKGKLHGLTTTHYRSGEKLWEVSYTNGSVDGMSYKYDRNGKVIEERKYVGGREIYSNIK